MCVWWEEGGREVYPCVVIAVIVSGGGSGFRIVDIIVYLSNISTSNCKLQQAKQTVFSCLCSA